MENCAYKLVCKGICGSSSCIKDTKTEENYWKEIQVAMLAMDKLERIHHYVSDRSKNVRLDIIEKMATLKVPSRYRIS